MPQSLASLHVHLIFSTKHRTPSIVDSLAPRLYDYIGGICKAEKCRLIAAGGMPDHIHLLVSQSRDISVSDLLRAIKANSSRWMHEQGLPEFVWQSGYGAFAVSYSQIPEVRKYISNQATHHRTQTFQEEFRLFLQRHNVEYDERYVWD